MCAIFVAQWQAALTRAFDNRYFHCGGTARSLPRGGCSNRTFGWREACRYAGTSGIRPQAHNYLKMSHSSKSSEVNKPPVNSGCGLSRMSDRHDHAVCGPQRVLLRRNQVTARQIAQKAPYSVDVEAGKTYYWCACGQSKKQPFCDGSHKETGIPVA